MPAQTGLTIRAANMDDAAAIAQLYAICIGNAEWLPPDARGDTDFAAVSHGEEIYVALNTAGALLGFVSVQRAQPFIHHLYCAAGARGQGVGRALLDALQQWLPQPWRLKCVRANLAAAAFYRRLGWREVGGGDGAHGPYALLEWR